MGKNGGADPVRDTAADEEFRYRGSRLGLPESGPGSIPGFGRRLAGLAIDWLLCLGVSYTFFDADPNVTLGIFALENVVLLMLIGTTVGKRLVGVRLASTNESSLTWPIAVIARTLLLCLVIPAVIFDQDQRGLHDRATGTVTQRI